MIFLIKEFVAKVLDHSLFVACVECMTLTKEHIVVYINLNDAMYI